MYQYLSGNVTLTLNREGKPRWNGGHNPILAWAIDRFGHWICFMGGTLSRQHPRDSQQHRQNLMYSGYAVQLSVGETRVLQDQIVFYSSNTIFWVAVKNDQMILHFRITISSKVRLRKEGQN